MRLLQFRKVNCEEKSLEALKKDFDKVARDLKKSVSACTSENFKVALQNI